MTSRVNLVAVLLTLGCLATALTQKNRSRHFIDERLLQEVHKKTLSLSSLQPSNTEVLQEHVGKIHADSSSGAEDLSMEEMETREVMEPRKKKMDRTMMALLMAYKMKFIALIPTLLGALVLLKGTALLAGFFFALFAAVLGLKVH